MNEDNDLRRDLAARDQQIAELAAQLAASEARAKVASDRAELFEAVLQSMGEGVSVLDTKGDNIFLNRASGYVAQGQDEKWREVLSFYSGDGSRPLTLEDMPHSKSLKTGMLCQEDMNIRAAHLPDDFTVSVTATPLRLKEDSPIIGVVTVFRDSTEHKRLEAELKRQNDALHASERENADLVDKLRMAIDEVSTPILEVWDDVLALPIIGIVDSQRSAAMMQRLLDSVVERRARSVVLDVTGVEVIDTSTAAHFINMVKAVELLGARCMLCGIRPAVARTLVALGLDLGQVRTFGNLKHALRASLGGGTLTASPQPKRDTSR